MPKEAKKILRDKSATTTIKISVELHNFIVEIKQYGETISDVILRLINLKKEEHKSCTKKDRKGQDK